MTLPRASFRACLFPWDPRGAGTAYQHAARWRVLAAVLLAAAVIPGECAISKRLIAYVILMTGVALSFDAVRRSAGLRRLVNRVLQLGLALLVGFGSVCFKGVGELAGTLLFAGGAGVLRPLGVVAWPLASGALLSAAIAWVWIGTTRSSPDHLQSLP